MLSSPFTETDKDVHFSNQAQELFENDKIAASDDDMRDLQKMLADMFMDNVKLRKRVNSIMRCALRTGNISRNSDEDPSKIDHVER